MKIQANILIIVASINFLILSACDHTSKVNNMTMLTSRLEPIFKTTKTVCFGRFLIDVPASAIVAWGDTDIPLGVMVYPNDFGRVKELAKNFIIDLQSKKAINHDYVPLLISVEGVSEPQGQIVIGYDGFQAINGLKINGYFKLGSDGVVIDSRPLKNRKDIVVANIKSISQRLRSLGENEIPSEAGNCIEHAFLADKIGVDTEPKAELIRIGFRLKEFPDTHLSILLTPSNPHYSEGNSLEWQLNRVENDLNSENPNHPGLRTKYLRRGGRKIHDWSDGFEALAHTPELPEMHSMYDFAMAFKGTPADPLKPYADIRMETGVVDNVTGATKSSLTEEEALAIWDKITSTIRVRPTTATSAKTADTAPRRFPIGELAATGRTCPQTGWWQATELGDMERSARRHINEGERMPPVMAPGEASIWQKLKGERPTYRTATVWKLVSYDDASVIPTDVATQSPIVAKAESPNGASDNGAPGADKQAASDKKG